MRDTETTLGSLRDLRESGLRIAMDDFGTGYSSLSNLRSFPFNSLKIDQSFIRDLGNTADSRAIVRAVPELSCTLGMSATAERVEAEDQLAILQSEGCTEVQGFLFSTPRPAAELPGLIARLGTVPRPAPGTRGESRSFLF